MTDPFIEALARIEESVRASDGEAMLARWDFGHEVLGRRVGKQLPSGVLVQILTEVGIGRQEVNNRVRVAEHYDREELSSKLESSSVTWTGLVDGLPKKRASGARSPKAPKVGPTAMTHVEADRVQTLIAKPDVAAELTRRAKTDDAARKAAKLVERQERAEARAQKERDEEAQHIQRVLRLRIVQGGTDWQNLIEQMETEADTLKRLVVLLEGLPIPDELQRKMFVHHVAAAQQALFEARVIVAGERHEESPEVDVRTGAIETVAL